MEKNESTTKEILKFYFETGKKPTEAQFSEFLDSYWHKKESIPKEKIEGLENLSLDFDLLWSPTNKKLSLTDAQGNVLSEISLQSLDNEGIDLRYNTATASLELYNADNELLDSIPVADFVNNVGTQLALNSNILQLKDSKGNVLSNVMFAVSNISGLQTVLDTKAEKTIAINTVSPLQGGGNLSSDRTLSISQSNTNTSGYLSNTDWNTFNNKFDKPSMGANYLGRWNGSTFINSLLQDNGTSSGIGSNNYNNIIWSVDSSSKAALIAPRMTQAQRLAISLGTIQAGAIVYQTDGTAGYYLWNGSSWGTLGSNIATADLTNTQARTFTQNADFTWNTLGNAYFLKGLKDVGSDYKDHPKVLRIDSNTKQVVEGDALVVTIPDTLPNPVTPTSQTLNIVHTYTNSPTALDTNVKDLNEFIMNIGNLQFTHLTVEDWNLINANPNTAAVMSASNGIALKSNNVPAFAQGEIMACAYPNLVLPANKNWVFVIGGTVGSNLSSFNIGVIGICESSAKTNVGVLNSYLSSLSAGWGYYSINHITSSSDTTPNAQRIDMGNSTCIFTKVGNILNTTVRSGSSVKTFNIDVTGINAFKPLCSLIKSMWNDNTGNCISDFGKYWIES
ncbi:hypothetical protein [Chryseobacterium sp. SL1]|uniref:hypothetical protein n=1 Tax=Chryseobacterium sp. SL1 TaxID=2995159 RepID=UPI002273F2DD|nr:hypothetical protein [Chryseobacterium sp. SL1]MCY1662517.1 hypothetical protein [Chryseobacterium sp. SL1]